jgi:plastocyanin
MRKSAIVLVMAALGFVGCGKSSNPTSPSDSSSTMLTVFIRNSVFTPSPLTVKVGMSVNWKNEDTINHNAVLEGTFDSGTIPPLSAHSIPAVMSKVGSYTYHCTLHGETGTIIVTQ